MTTCPHAQHGICQLATGLANQPVPLDPQACTACQRDTVPMSINRVTAAIACHAQRNAGVEVNRELAHIATGRYNLAGFALEREIHGWLKWLKITVPPDCGCDGWVAKMNGWGWEGSIERIDEIVDHLFDAVQLTYLSPIAVSFLSKPIIKRVVLKCLLKKLTSSR